MVIGMLFASPILVLFGASEEGLSYAYPYMMIYLIGTVPSMIATGMNPFINAQGYATSGMLSVTIGAVANLILDPLFIFGLNLGIKGAAIATITAQAISGCLCLIFIWKKVETLQLRTEDCVGKGNAIRTMLIMGVPMGLQYSITAIGSMVMQSANNGLGSVYVSGFTAAARLK